MSPPRYKWILRYLFALACIALATWLRLLLDPALADRVPFITYFAAIALTAYYGGFGPTLLAIVAGALVANYYFIWPRYEILPRGPEAWASLLLFALVGMMMALLSELMHRSRQAEKISKEDARREQQRFQTTLASIGEGVIVTDADGKVTFLNSVAEVLTGCERTSVKGLPVETVVRFLDERTHEPVDNPVIRVLRGQSPSAMVEHPVLLSRDGRETSVEQSAAPLLDPGNEIAGVVLVCRDVSHTRRWNLERGRLAALLASSEDAVIGLSVRGAVVTWNAGAEKLYGYTAEEAVGQRLSTLIVPPDQTHEFNDILTRIARNERVDVLETVRSSKSGRRVDVSKRVSPILDTDGRIIGISTIDRDISQQRAAERRRNARLAITQMLAQDPTIEVAVQRTLEEVCSGLGWAVGCFWTPDVTDNELHCRQIWHEPSLTVTPFRTKSLATPLPRGVGLPGRVWEQEDCVWIVDIEHEAGFPRAATAAEAGLHGAFGCPIRVGGDFLGVFEFLHREVRQPDEDVLEMMGTVAHQIGQFLERKRGEEALRKSEEELRQRVKELIDTEERIRGVIDTAMDAIVTIDERGILQTFNPAAERLFGRSAAEMIGLSIQQLMPDLEWSQRGEIVVRDPETGQTHRIGGGREVRGVRSDGSSVPIELALSEFHLKGRRYFTGTLHDITERKRTEATLRFLADASKLFSQLVDYPATLQRVAQLAVPAFADYCAVDLLSPEGKLERLAVSHTDPELLKRIEEFYQSHPHHSDAPFGPPKVVRTGRSDWSAELTDAMLQDAAADEESLTFFRHLKPRSYMCVPLIRHDETCGTLSFVLTTSGRRYGAADLAVAEELAQRAGIALENARLYQQVREADRRKDEFLAMLAHELRNPLAPIRSGLDLLALQTPAASETLEIMQRQVDHVVRLVDDLLDVSRIMRGKVELRRSPVELSSLVAQAMDAVQETATEEAKSIAVTLPEEPVWLDVDRVRIVQVLENLLHNAVKYSDHGARIELEAERGDEEAVIRVRDNGIGIDAELLPKVFDLFTQSTRTLDRAQGGLGIGLTLVRNLVQMHGGKVSAHSEGVGRGSEFVVRLPLAVRIAASADKEPAVRPDTGPRRVLIVDDNAGAAKLLAALVTKLGPHAVEVAHDGPAALAKVPEFHPDIMLLDIGLPGMNGLEVAQAVRRLKAGRRLRLVAVTGYGQEEDRRRSLEAGCDLHVVKPVSVTMLADILTHDSAHQAAETKQTASSA